MIVSYLPTIFSSKKDKQIKKLLESQKNAKSYSEWCSISKQLDQLEGLQKWKQEDYSDIYDYELIRHRTRLLRDCRKSGDMAHLLFLVRTQFERNLGNMGDTRLYSCHVGTKQLIEEYISECEKCLQALLNCNTLPETRILNTLIQTRKNFGRTALLLSGGSILGLLHVGVMRELMHANLLPRIICGTSAGSIFASVLAIHLDHEIDELFDTLIHEKFDIFEETGNEESFFVRLARFLKHGTILDNKYLVSTLQKLLGNITFQEAYNRTRKILNVTVSPASIYESARILNYLTAPNVLIWSAVCASCSVPFIFPQYTLLAKDSTTAEIHPWSPSPLKFIDGSVDNDLPLTRLSELFNVNHFIACQVNPHVAPLLRATSAITTLVDKNSKGPMSKTSVTFSWKQAFNETQSMLTEELSHYLFISHELGVCRNLSSKLRSLITQQYTGDITIVPNVTLTDLRDLFKNPNTESFIESHLRGQRALWPKFSLIRNHCAIELALDKAIHELRSRMIPNEKSSSMISRNSVQGELGRKLHYSTANITDFRAYKQQLQQMHQWQQQQQNQQQHYQPLLPSYQQQHPAPYYGQQQATSAPTHHDHHQHQHGHVRRKSEQLTLIKKSWQDLNATERTIRSPTISRKNSYKNMSNL